MASAFRVTTYELRDDAAAFQGLTFELTLEQDLEQHYFVIMQPAGAGAGDAIAGARASESSARITADPFGTGDLGVSSGSDKLELTRTNDISGQRWQGTVTVVECLSAHDSAGFRLRDVVEVTATGTSTEDDAAASGVVNINQSTVHGGHYGGGASTDDDEYNGYQSVLARIALFDNLGTPTVRVQRTGVNGPGLQTSIFACYVVEWGSEWSVQKVSQQGASLNGGDGVDAVGEYVTETITSVVRAETFVTFAGAQEEDGIGDAAAADVWTLGDGVNQNANETEVAAGNEYGGMGYRFEWQVLSHPDLSVEYLFGADGTADGIQTSALTGTRTTQPPVDAGETYDNASADVRRTSGHRLFLVSNSQNGTGSAFPRPLLGGRHTASTTAEWQRSRHGQPGALWVQTIDFGGIAGGSDVSPSGPAAEDQVGVAPGLTPGPASVTPSGPAAEDQVGVAPGLTPGPASVTPSAPAAEDQVGVAPGLAPGPAPVTPSAPAAEDQIGVAPVVSSASGSDVSPSGPAAEDQVGVAPVAAVLEDVRLEALMATAASLAARMAAEVELESDLATSCRLEG